MEISQEQSPAVRDRRPEALGNLRVLPDELICETLGLLPCRDVGRLSCVSSVMYILCNEEPLWMNLCLNNVKGPLQYKGSWKKTALSQEHLLDENEGLLCKPLHFDGFSSLFLYRRFYRCYTSLNGFSFDDGNVERKNSLSLDEFNNKYDAQKPVLLSGLADAWPARSTWTIDQLLLNYGETVFKISQRSARKIKMKFNDYISYAKIQHDEDPLYIFDEKFGEVAPGLLNDYSVPSVFPEDFFDILDDNQRPSFRWLIIGPERSGASWHVDPALTSAWNTLLCGRKRWALYPPGKVPIGVTVHVNEDDGDVNIETPSSLQWWLDFYPLLSDEDKPVECTQLPGETIYVPSGWWHCVLNLETTVAVTQNYVNSRNFQFVCLDMAPGYSHKGVCRAGLLALDEDSFEKSKKNISNCGNGPNYLDLTRKEKRVRISNCAEDSINDDGTILKCRGTRIEEFCYDIKFLSLFLDKERDHYNSLWSSSSCLGQREMREWLYRLWACKPHMRELVWKGACLALNADRWLETVSVICAFHNLPYPMDSERLPVGTGSNPVFLIADYVVKVYVEGGLEASLYGLGTELEFYDMLSKVNSQLKDHIPDVLASGFVFLKNGSFEVESWDGRGVPKVIAGSTFNSKVCTEDRFPFGVWSKKLHDYRNVGLSACESVAADGSMKIWPYIITKRCRGTIFAQLRDILSSEDTLALASFLGEQLHNLHLLPCPPFYDVTTRDQMSDLKLAVTMSDVTDEIGIPTGWKIFIKTLNRKKKFISSQLTKWGDPIPSNLIGKVDEYLPDDFTDLLNMSKDEGLCKVSKACSWIHSDIMDDNIIMEPYSDDSHLIVLKADMVDNGNFSSHGGSSGGFTWRPSHIVDFGNMSIGDRLCDLIAIHLDVFRGNTRLFKHLLQSYKLPLLGTLSSHVTVDGGSKFGRLSYHAMCYCIMHEDNVLGAIFSLWSELRAAESWEEVEEKVWGELNNYKGSG